MPESDNTDECDPSAESELPLFRPEVLEAKTQQWMGTIVLRQPVSDWVLALLASGITACLIGFLFLGSYTRHELVSGQLIPSQGLLPLTATSLGVVTNVRVHEGESVEKDQALVDLSREVNNADGSGTQLSITTDLKKQREEVLAILQGEQALEDQRRQDLTSRINMIKQQLIEIERQSTTQGEEVNTAAKRVEKLKPYVKSGSIAEAEFERYESDALNSQMQLNALNRQRLETEQQLSASQDELAELPLKSETQRNELRLRLSAVDQSLLANEAQRANVFRAPESGVVADLVVRDGQAVTAGQRLLSIIPKGSRLEAQLWLPSRAIGFVERGDRVILRYQAFPYQRFGQQAGRVLEISRSATSPAELSSSLGKGVLEPLYSILVELEHETVHAYGKEEPLRAGMALEADILLDKRGLIEWLMEPIYQYRRGSS